MTIDFKFDFLKLQLQILPDLIKTYNEQQVAKIKKVTLLSSLYNVMNTISVSKTMLSEVFKLLCIFLIIPITTTTAERTFSSLRRF